MGQSYNERAAENKKEPNIVEVAFGSEPQNYVVQQWYLDKVRTARWARFGHPDLMPKRGRAAFRDVWRWDVQKAEKGELVCIVLWNFWSADGTRLPSSEIRAKSELEQIGQDCLWRAGLMIGTAFELLAEGVLIVHCKRARRCS